MAQNNDYNHATKMSLKGIQSLMKQLYETQNYGSTPNINSTDTFGKSREKNDLNRDIEILETILQSIIDYETNKTSIRDTLITIGGLFGKISFNDNGDRDSHYIRNRYGYIRRNQNKSINKYGIYFERLYNFKIIFSNDRVYSRITKKEINNLGNSLCCLRQRIADILAAFKPSIDYRNAIDNRKIDISYLTEFSRKYYEPMILERIVEEIEPMITIDFSIKDDRYYFARVFCIVGELFNEYLEDQSKEEDEQCVRKSLKYFIKLRNQLVHHHDKLKYGFGNDNQLMSEMIIEIVHHLKQLILNSTKGENQWSINSSYGDAQKFHDVTGRFLKIFTEKLRKKKTKIIDSVKRNHKSKESEVFESDEDIKNKLKRLIRRACGIIEGTEIEVKVKTKNETSKSSIEGQLSFLNDQYQRHLNKLEPDDRNNYPHVLDLSNKDIMSKINECTHQNSVTKCDPIETGMEKLVSKIKSLQEEIDYVFDLCDTINTQSENGSDQSFLKKMSYILQYIVAVIGQFVRDIQNVNICGQSRTKHVSDSNTDDLSKYSLFNKFSSSIVMNEAIVKSKYMRNHGLAHDIWSYQGDEFMKGLDEIMSVSSYFSKYYYIFVNDIKSLTADVFSLMGRACYLIGLYEKAINYLEKAQVRFRDYPSEVDVLDNSNDEVRNVFQMELMEVKTSTCLLSAYEKCGYSDKVFITGELILKQIQFDKITGTDILASQFTYFVLHSLLTASRDLEYFKPIIEKLENAHTTNNDVYLTCFRSEFYDKIGNHEKIKELNTKIYDEASIVSLKFGALKMNVISILEDASDETKNDEIVANIDEMERILDDNLSEFKYCFGDEYPMNMKVLLILKLRVMKKQNITNYKELEIQKIKKFSYQFKQFNSKFPEIFIDYFKVLVDFYQFFMGFFIHTSLKLPDSRAESLKEARYYYDLLVDNIDRFPAELWYLKPFLINRGQFICYSVVNNLNLSHEDKISHLLRIFSHSQEMNSFEYDLLIALAGEFYLMGEDCMVQYYDEGKEDIAALAIYCYDNAIKYNGLVLENPLKVGRAISWNLKLTGYCLSSKSVLIYELRSFVQCIDYWNLILSLSLDGFDRICANECKEVIEDLLFEIYAVLIKIIDSTNGGDKLQLHDEYIIRYLRRKFNIEIVTENNVKRWVYRGMLSSEELRNQIKLELSYVYKSSSLSLKTFQ